MAANRIQGRGVLVTGGCGFIGSHLVRALVARGADRVVALDSLRCGDPAHVEGRPGARVVRFELGTDPDDRLAEAFEGINYVLHFAAEKHQASRARPRELVRANVEGTHQLLEAAAAAKVRKVVFASSLYAYGRTSGPPMREDELPRPVTVYGTSKLAGEHLCATFLAERGPPYVALRYFFVYGPRQFAGQGYKSVIVKSCERILAGEAPEVFGDGEQMLDYVFVDDAVEATLRALESDVSGEVVNVGSGYGVTVNALIDTLLEASGSSVGKRSAPADWTAGSSRVGDVGKARALLGFTATTSLADGLARTFRWIRDGGP